MCMTENEIRQMEFEYRFSDYFTIPECHWHLWNELYEMTKKDFERLYKDARIDLYTIKNRIIHNMARAGVIRSYRVLHRCFLCAYPCYNCPYTEYFGHCCTNSYSVYKRLGEAFWDYNPDKEQVLQYIADIRDCINN